MNGQKEAEPGAEAREALKKKGEDYFQKVLDQARKGRNPLNEDPRSKTRPKDLESQNEDLETVGEAIPYLFGALYYASVAAWLPLAKLSLGGLQTPCIQVFLHLLPAAITLYCIQDIGPLNVSSLHGASISIAISGIQILTVLGALNYSSVYLTLAWTILIPPCLDMYNIRARAFRLSPLKAVFLAISGVGPMVCIFGQLWPSVLGIVCLVTWAVVEGVRLIWEDFKGNSHLEILPAGLQDKAAIIALKEKELSPSCLAFLKAAVTAVPALLLGFILQEGDKLIDHELSVPAVSNILLSCLAWTIASVAGVSYFKRSKLAAKQSLTAFTAIASTALWATLDPKIDWLKLAAASVTVLGGIGAQQCRDRATQS